MPTVVSGGPSVHKRGHSAATITALSDPAPHPDNFQPAPSVEDTDFSEESVSAVRTEPTLSDSDTMEGGRFEVQGDSSTKENAPDPWDTPHESQDPSPAQSPSTPKLRGRHILLLQTVLCLLLAGGLWLLPTLSPQTATQLHPLLQEKFTTGDGILDSLTTHYQAAMAWLSAGQSKVDATSTDISEQATDDPDDTVSGNTKDSTNSEGEESVVDVKGRAMGNAEKSDRGDVKDSGRETPTDEAKDTAKKATEGNSKQSATDGAEDSSEPPKASAKTQP